ncbi:MAG: hypothetical protein JJU29_23285 [Verrucomicrobia bacterium]|nr:hypothetical protein [Verrucomicrobiota bacterium]MCH8514354.1 hypothetical protein [Kiritimatiellia bacterium]
MKYIKMLFLSLFLVACTSVKQDVPDHQIDFNYFSSREYFASAKYMEDKRWIDRLEKRCLEKYEYLFRFDRNIETFLDLKAKALNDSVDARDFNRLYIEMLERHFMRLEDLGSISESMQHPQFR